MKETYFIQNLDCAHCAARIEEAVRKIAGVSKASVSLITQRLIVETAEENEGIEEEIQKIVRKIEPDYEIVK